MTKKLAKFRRRHAKGNPPTANPPLATDLVGYIVPGFAAFAATRFLTRVASVQIAKRWPKQAKHAGAVASISAFAASWFGAHRVQALAKYHDAIVVGSGIAALQSLIQIYLPALGWVVSDASAEVAAAPTKEVSAGRRSPLPPSTNQAPPVPDGFSETDANTWFSYNDSFEARSRGKQKAPPPRPMTSTAPDDDQVDDIIDGTD